MSQLSTNQQDHASARARHAIDAAPGDYSTTPTTEDPPHNNNPPTLYLTLEIVGPKPAKKLQE